MDRGPRARFFAVCATTSEHHKPLSGSPLLSAFLCIAFSGAFIYTFLLIMLFMRLGYWEPQMWKATSLWLFGTGLGAVFRTDAVDRKFLRDFALHSIALIAWIEFVVNLYTFPILFELALLPAVTLLLGVQVISKYPPWNAPQFASTRIFVDACLGILGLVIIVSSVAITLGHIESFLTIGTGKDFALPLLLALFFLPYVYIIHYIVVLQSALHMSKFYLKDRPQLYRDLRFRLLTICGSNLNCIEHFRKDYESQLFAVNSESELALLMEAFYRSLRSS
jgi:hypothetical protein